MNYSIMIAAAFILATIAVATLSPFDHLPPGAPQDTAAAPTDEGSSSDDSSYSPPPPPSSSANDGSSNDIKWPPNEAPPQ